MIRSRLKNSLASLVVAVALLAVPSLFAAEAAVATKAPAAPKGPPPPMLVSPVPVVLLWPNGAPGSEGKIDPEKMVARGQVASIHQPSIAIFLPAADQATGAAVLVIPGGGHRFLSMESEGYNVGTWLSEHGIAAFVLKHRLAREAGSTYKIEVESLQDTQRAIRISSSCSSPNR